MRDTLRRVNAFKRRGYIPWQIAPFHTSIIMEVWEEVKDRVELFRITGAVQT